MSLLRVMVVDDSPLNRRRLVRAVEQSGLGEVVATAANGAEALRLTGRFTPDAITLDLEMPGMDGFTFLRLLMNRRPTPVIVVSGNNQQENVFRALELGALDFISKSDDGESESLERALARKLSLVRAARNNLNRRMLSAAPLSPRPGAVRRRQPRHVVAVASSTGGPTAVTEVLSHLSPKPDFAVVIAQHMPANFTATFAQRLNRFCALEVSEAKDGEPVLSGRVLVCPGDHCMELVAEQAGGFRVGLFKPTEEEHYVPNASRLLGSVGRAMGSRAVGVVLTGMGEDGASGAKAIAERGGRVLVESERTAVVYGMPRATLAVVPDAASHDLANLPVRIMALLTS